MAVEVEEIFAAVAEDIEDIEWGENKGFAGVNRGLLNIITHRIITHTINETNQPISTLKQLAAASRKAVKGGAAF